MGLTLNELINMNECQCVAADLSCALKVTSRVLCLSSEELVDAMKLTSTLQEARVPFFISYF